MAVSQVCYGEIVEVTFKFPGEGYKVHPALALSGNNLREDDDGMFYAVLLSSKNYNPQYTLELKNEWLTKPMLKQSYLLNTPTFPHDAGFFDCLKRKSGESSKS